MEEHIETVAKPDHLVRAVLGVCCDSCDRTASHAVVRQYQFPGSLFTHLPWGKTPSPVVKKCSGCKSVAFFIHLYCCRERDAKCWAITKLSPSVSAACLCLIHAGLYGGESGGQGDFRSFHLYPPILALFLLPGMWLPGCLVLKCFTSLPLLGNLPSCRLTEVQPYHVWRVSS